MNRLLFKIHLNRQKCHVIFENVFDLIHVHTPSVTNGPGRATLVFIYLFETLCLAVYLWCIFEIAIKGVFKNKTKQVDKQNSSETH